MLAKKYSQHLLLAGIAIFAGGISAYLVVNPLLSKKSEAACQGSPHKLQFTLTPDFYLNKKFLSENPLSERDLAAYVDRHLRYTVTTVQTFDPKQSPKFATIPAEGYKVTKITSEETNYPLTLSIWKSPEFFGSFLERIEKRADIDSDYLARAMAAGSTSTSDVAIHVSYEVEVTLFACDSKNQKIADKLSLPQDPFLAFWFVPENKNVVKFHEVFTRDFKTTPCASNEFMNDFDPYYYWYYWTLAEKGCETALTANSIKEYPLLKKRELSLEPKEPFELKFLDKVKGRKLRVTANFTMIDDDSVIVPDPFTPILDSQIPEIINIDKFSQVRSALDSLQNFDIALRTGLVFAWSMRKISSQDFKLETLAREDMFLQWRLTGKLKNSQQPYEILVSIGSAMDNKPSYKKFYEALNQGLSSSDIVYFGGHSGVGKNLSVNRLQEGFLDLSDKLPAQEIPDHQLVMLMTCYSLHYFPAKNFPLPKQKNLQRDLLYTASLPSGYDARMLTGLMVQVDKYFENGNSQSFEKWPKVFKGDVFLVHQRQ